MDIAKIRKKIREAKKEKTSTKKSAVTKKIKKYQSGESLAASGTETLAPEKQLSGVKGDEVEMLSDRLPDHEDADEEEKAPDLVEFLKFRLGNEAYAFRISAIEEILRPQGITIVPRADPYMIGITSFRGKIIPVVDIGKKFKVDRVNGEGFDRAKIVILRGPRDSVGVPVEGRMDVILLPESDIKEPPSRMSENDRKLVEGVVMIDDGFVTIVSLEEVLDFNLTGGA